MLTGSTTLTRKRTNDSPIPCQSGYLEKIPTEIMACIIYGDANKRSRACLPDVRRTYPKMLLNLMHTSKTLGRLKNTALSCKFLEDVIGNGFICPTTTRSIRKGPNGTIYTLCWDLSIILSQPNYLSRIFRMETFLTHADFILPTLECKGISYTNACFCKYIMKTKKIYFAIPGAYIDLYYTFDNSGIDTPHEKRIDIRKAHKKYLRDAHISTQPRQCANEKFMVEINRIYTNYPATILNPMFRDAILNKTGIDILISLMDMKTLELPKTYHLSGRTINLPEDDVRFYANLGNYPDVCMKIMQSGAVIPPDFIMSLVYIDTSSEIEEFLVFFINNKDANFIYELIVLCARNRNHKLFGHPFNMMRIIPHIFDIYVACGNVLPNFKISTYSMLLCNTCLDTLFYFLTHDHIIATADPGLIKLATNNFIKEAVFDVRVDLIKDVLFYYNEHRCDILSLENLPKSTNFTKKYYALFSILKTYDLVSNTVIENYISKINNETVPNLFPTFLELLFSL